MANPAVLRGWKNHLIPSCFNSKRKMNCRVGLGRKFGAAAAGEESQVFLEAWFCFEWNVGVPPFSLHVGGGLWDSQAGCECSLCWLRAGMGGAPLFQDPIPELSFLTKIHVGSFETFVSPAQRDSSCKWSRKLYFSLSFSLWKIKT